MVILIVSHTYKHAELTPGLLYSIGCDEPLETLSECPLCKLYAQQAAEEDSRSRAFSSRNTYAHWHHHPDYEWPELFRDIGFVLSFSTLKDWPHCHRLDYIAALDKRRREEREAERKLREQCREEERLLAAQRVIRRRAP